MRTGRIPLALLLTLLTGVVLAGCTGSSGSGGDAGGAATNGGATADSAPLASAASRHPQSSGSVSDAGVQLAPDLILTGSLSIVVRSVSDTVGRADSIVASAAGRTDADDRDAPRGSLPSAELTLRVPNSSVPSVMNRLAGLGRVRDRRLSTRDVTADVADVNSRVASARSAIRSLRSLYARATKVSDVIRIEATLSQREAQLESFEARARSLGAQVALATITLDLTQRKVATPPMSKAAGRGGFLGGLDHGWHAFTAALSGLAVAVGAVLPFLLVVVVIGVGALAVRRRRAGPPSPTSTE